MRGAVTDRYDRTHVDQAGERAVVLGASVAGLLAARVLADAFEQVTVVDRDPLDDDSRSRRGVPQGRHPHVMMVAGQDIMEDLTPGITADLVTSGAQVLDLSREADMHAADGLIARGTADLPMYFATRPLIEGALRARVRAHDRIAVRTDAHATDLRVSVDGRAVEGVVAHDEGRPREIPADLVVDATGRSSRAPRWLEQLGYPTPVTEAVHVDLAYRTCQVERPEGDRRAILVMPRPPRLRGAIMVPIEDGRWFVTLTGMHGDHAPADPDGLRDFASTLPTPLVREVLDDHDLVSRSTAHYRFPASTRSRYDQLEVHPRGLISIGDAVASFNPIYGQGMTVSALQAVSLHHALADHGVQDLARGFYERTRKVIDNAWNMAAGGDFQFAQTEGAKPRGTDLVNRYMARLQHKAHADSQLADAFKRVVAMQQPPTSLFGPRLVWRVVRPKRRIVGGPPPKR